MLKFTKEQVLANRRDHKQNLSVCNLNKKKWLNGANKIEQNIIEDFENEKLIINFNSFDNSKELRAYLKETIQSAYDKSVANFNEVNQDVNDEDLLEYKPDKHIYTKNINRIIDYFNQFYVKKVCKGAEAKNWPLEIKAKKTDLKEIKKDNQHAYIKFLNEETAIGLKLFLKLANQRPQKKIDIEDFVDSFVAGIEKKNKQPTVADKINNTSISDSDRKRFNSNIISSKQKSESQKKAMFPPEDFEMDNLIFQHIFSQDLNEEDNYN